MKTIRRTFTTIIVLTLITVFVSACWPVNRGNGRGQRNQQSTYGGPKDGTGTQPRDGSGNGPCTW